MLILIQDTEQVAKKLKEVSNGNIKTGVYHSKIPDSEKEDLHKAWRCGTIKVVCATIGILYLLFNGREHAYTSMLYSVWPWDRQSGCAVCAPPLSKQFSRTPSFRMNCAEPPRYRYLSVVLHGVRVST